MATQWDWITDSTAQYTPPPPPTLTTAPTLAPLQIPPWGAPTTNVPQPGAVGTPMPNGFMVNPYLYPLPPPAAVTAAGPSIPIPPGPPSQPTPPTSAALGAPGPQTPPMGPFGAGAGGMGALTVASTLPDGKVGSVYSGQLVATGGKAPYTWTATPLPAGLSVNAGTGAITGTPTTAATTNVVATVTDATTPTALTANKTIPVVVAA